MTEINTLRGNILKFQFYNPRETTEKQKLLVFSGGVIWEQLSGIV